MKRIHMMGILGSGMSGVASLASKMGYTVTGCDLNDVGHDKAHLTDIDYLVVSPAVLYQNKKHPEFIEGQKRNVVMTWEEFVGKHLMKDKFVIAVAGTHGKSTTTAMIGKLLIDNGFDPTVLLGAKVPEWGGNSRYGKSKYFVIEADEFNDNFLNYNPNIIIINNIEYDHPDYFKNKNQFEESFKKFIKKLTGKKLLITEKDSKNKKFNLLIFGKHNQKNANMVYILGKKLKINEKNIIQSIESFKGIGRRMEEIETNIFDDYAHHPTAIKTTIDGLREKYPNNKIWAIIEPHGYKRTKSLLKLYKDVFVSADEVIIGPIYKARDKRIFGITNESIARVSNHNNIKITDSVEQMIQVVRNGYQLGDLIVVMGAGDSNKWAKEISKLIYGYSFKDLTTLKVGGEIKHFVKIKNQIELVKKIKSIKKEKLPIFIIGSGSDIAVSDNDFNGVVIKFEGDTLKIQKLNDSSYLVTAEAGVVWDKLVELTVNRNLTGLESLSGIPGTVGAAPIQNIGAYGHELSDCFVNLIAYDIENEKFVKFNKKDCKFSYRESIFKEEKYWQKFLITEVTFRFNQNSDKDIDLKKVRNEILRVRSEKLDDPDIVPNAGSFFKNPLVNLRKKIELEKKDSNLKTFEFGDNFKIPAGYLIEQCGWKGKSLGLVKVSDKHALIITNPEGKGTFDDIKKLADHIIKDVYKKYKIKLVPEVQYINI